MKILEMTATFGGLDHATLRPGPGFTLVEAPNEAGKSTWAAFLRAMLYGFPPGTGTRRVTSPRKTAISPGRAPLWRAPSP